VDTFAYLPLYPPGTPQFDETAAGWLTYTDAVLDLVESVGITNYDVEIWNELTFGSDFLSVNAYYEPRLVDDPVPPVRRGGRMWELARRTTDAIHAQHRGAQVIWGFSSTNFGATRVTDLPPGTNGQSYHPYKTRLYRVPEEFPPTSDVRMFRDGYLPSTSVVVPEGLTALAVTPLSLTRLLHPQLRLRDRPAGVTSFSHFITEHGFAPREAGITSTTVGDQLQARALLRSTTFWLNKGITRMEVSSAWNSDPLGNGLLATTHQPYAWGSVPPSALRTPALAALGRLTAAFDGAQAIASPRQLGVGVTALGTQTASLPASGSTAPVYLRDQFTFLPYQVNATRFVIPTYVMTHDIRTAPPDSQFRVTINGVDGRSAGLSMYDPLTDTTVPVTTVSSTATSVTVVITVTDYPRLLVVDEAGGQ
jgi:hypothetical protein